MPHTRIAARAKASASTPSGARELERLARREAETAWTDAPGMNRTCARGLGTSVRKSYLQGKVGLSTSCAPVNAPVL